MDRFFLSNLQVIVESSANKLNLKNWLEDGKSLMNKRKSSGPKIEPWGTPCVIGSLEEVMPLTLTYCERLSKYDRNQIFTRPRMPF